jgi:tRNA(fMet)-specific endonuclease VapC
VYLFDTDCVVELLRGRLPPSARRKFDDVPAAAQHISAVTVSELVCGARRTCRPEHHLRAIETVLLPRVKVVEFDASAAFVAGTLRARLEVAGEPLSFPDLLIAAMAVARDLTLVTGNTRRFARVPGLKVENWLAGDEEQPRRPLDHKGVDGVRAGGTVLP